MSLIAAQTPLQTLASNARRNFQDLIALKKAVNGYCWMDLFEVPIPRARRTKFPTIAALNQLANEFEKSSERFEVKYLARGVIHVDLSDGPTAKTVNEILALNGDILVGGQWSFSDELQKLGFSHDFINKYSRYNIDTMFDSSASSTDSTTLHDPSSTLTWVNDCHDRKPGVETWIWSR
jgi:hypothetical protein